MTPYISIEAFRAGRQWSDDIGTALSDASLTNFKGWLYCDRSLWIGALPLGGWWLQLGNQEWSSSKIEELERILYEWACAEGYCDDEAQIAINRRLEDEARADRSSGRAQIGHGEVLDDERARNPTPDRRIFWVASYSDDGLEVDHYWTEAEQKQAIANTLRRFYTGETPLPEDDNEAVIQAYTDADSGTDNDFSHLDWDDLDSLTWGDEVIPTLQ